MPEVRWNGKGEADSPYLRALLIGRCPMARRREDDLMVNLSLRLESSHHNAARFINAPHEIHKPRLVTLLRIKR